MIQKELFATDPREKARAFNKHVSARFEVITPSDAEELLTHNWDNRKLKEDIIEKVGRDAVAGKFRTNGETIIIGPEPRSRLLDGQNRLRAIADSGVPVVTLVVRGIPEEYWPSIDTGSSRTAYDVLHTNANAAILSASGVVLWRYERGMINGSWKDYPTRDELLATIKKHGGKFEEAVAFARGHRFPGLGSGTTATLLYLFSQVDKDRAMSFFIDLLTGDGVRSQTSVGLARAKLLENATKKVGRLQGKVIASLIIRSWNATMDGRGAVKMQMVSRSGEVVQIPAIFGLKPPKTEETSR